MNRTALKAAMTLVALVVYAGTVRAQKSSTTKRPAPAPTTTTASLARLEEMLATALKYNADIRMAELKLRDDEAELNRTRLRVIQKVIALHHSLQSFQSAVENAQAKYKRLSALVRRGTMQPAVLQEAEHELAQARAKYAEIKSELPYLLGNQSPPLAQEIIRTELQIGGSRRSAASTIPARMAAKIRQALETPIKVDYQAVPFGDILRGLGDQANGVAIQRNLVLRDLTQVKIDLRLGEVPLGAALLALQDAIPGLRIVVRDYGLLITWEHQVPLGAVRLYDFWKSKYRGKNGR